MKKLLLSILAFFIHSSIFLQAQPGCDKIEFSGTAPAIWSINGQINDWETILGPGSGDPLFPFNPPASTFNYFTELFDTDNPDPSRDLRSFAFVHDDYNVYFYFRRLQNGNAQNSFYYFFDINLDGLMNFGEPVVYANFNSKNISPIAIGFYTPNTSIAYDVAGNGNYMAQPDAIGRCFVNGYSMPGEVTEIFNSASIPVSNSLDEHEVFSAAITEDGYGVEFAIPWSYLKNWQTNSAPLDPVQDKDLFIYRVSLQNGAGKYQAHKTSDNIGGENCGSLFPTFDLATSGFPSFELQSSSAQLLSPGYFRLKLEYKNTLDVPVLFDAGDIIFKTIQATPGSVANVSGFIINVYTDKNCNQVIDSDEPANRFFHTQFPANPDSVVYSGPLRLNSVGPMQSICLIVDIRFPEDNSVSSVELELIPRASITVKTNCPCDGCGPLDGGKPINPIGFTLGDEETTADHKEHIYNEETTNSKNKITVYPNPSTGSTTVVLPADEGVFNLTLADYTGRVIRKWSAIKQRVLKLENLKPGYYLLSIMSKNDNNIITKKIIIQ